jgi:hypothetical protein
MTVSKTAKPTKLNWSKMLGFDQLARVEAFSQTRTIKHSGAARVGGKGLDAPKTRR